MLDAHGRVVMVSGASRGIGRALAERLHNDGFRLSLGVRYLADVADLTDQWTDSEAGFSVHQFDAFDPASQRQWVSDTVKHFGHIDALINNAGILSTCNLTDFDEVNLDRMWEVNAKTPARLTHLVMSHLRARPNGRVINMVSLTGKRLRSGGLLGYGMTKHAAIALTQATRSDGWDDGIRATAICPSYVGTDMINDFDTGNEPVIDPDDLAQLVSTVLCLPNHAVVAELIVNCRNETVIPNN